MANRKRNTRLVQKADCQKLHKTHESEFRPQSSASDMLELIREYIEDEDLVLELHNRIMESNIFLSQEELIKRLQLIYEHLKGTPGGNALLHALKVDQASYRDTAQALGVNHQTICNHTNAVKDKLDKTFSTHRDRYTALGLKKRTYFYYKKDPAWPKTYWEQILYCQEKRRRLLSILGVNE